MGGRAGAYRSIGDCALTLGAQQAIGCHGEVGRFSQWLGAVCMRVDRVRWTDLTSAERAELMGRAGRPPAAPARC